MFGHEIKLLCSASFLSWLFGCRTDALSFPLRVGLLELDILAQEWCFRIKCDWKEIEQIKRKKTVFVSDR